MAKIKNVTKRLKCNQSIREIHRETGIHRTIIRETKELAKEQGWLEGELPGEADISKVWRADKKRAHVLDAYKDKLLEWQEKGYSYEVMHQLIKEECPCTPSSLRHYVVRRFPKPSKPVMVRSTVPGEVMDVDFGYLGIFMGKKVWFFTARLRHSRKAYREITFDQKEETFFSCHVNAFEFFGGVPKKVVLDNLKAGVIKSRIDNDLINRAYCELAEHYGFMICPCLPRTPQHKGGVENDVKYVKHNFLPLFKEKNEQTISALKKALMVWGEQAETRIISGVGRSPIEIFSEESKMLSPLPAERWEKVTWASRPVRRDWRILYDKAHYSVPYKYIDKTVLVRITKDWVKIFYEHEEIAFHERASAGEYRRISSHAPPEKEEVLQCSEIGLLSWAEKIGPYTVRAIEEIFEDRRVDRLRPARCLLRLSRKYSKMRLERACERALYYDTVSYVSVKTILEKNLDEIPLRKEKMAASKSFRFARLPTYYQNQCKTEEQYNDRIY